MIQDEQTLRRTTAKNIAAYRKAHKDTQLDLARKLNYSDKSVSKWERGEGLPDVYILAQIAQLYGITVSNLIGEEEPPKKSNPHFHIYVVLLSVALVFVIAAILFTAFTIAAVPFPSWLFFPVRGAGVEHRVHRVHVAVVGHSDAGAFHYGAHLVGRAVHLSLHPVDTVSEAHLRRLCRRAGAHHALGAVPLLQNKNMVLKRTFRARRAHCRFQSTDSAVTNNGRLFRHQKSDRQSVWRRGMSAPATDLQLLQCK